MVGFDQNVAYIFNIVSPAVRTLLPSVLQCLDFRGIEALILVLEKVLDCRYYLIIGLILLPSQGVCFLHVGGQKLVTWRQILRIWKVTRLFKATVMQSIHCNHELVCAGALSWWNWTPFVSFPGRFEMSIVLLFIVLNYLSIVSYLEETNAVSIRIGLF